MKGNQVVLSDVFHPKYLGYLKHLGTDSVPHGVGTLFDHLVGTAHLLFKWNNSVPVCLAGMFHSIYGTRNFKNSTLLHANRLHMREMIGSDSERLVYLFSTCDRRIFYSNLAEEGDAIIPSENNNLITVPRQVLLQLLEIEVANMLDMTSAVSSLQTNTVSSARLLANSLKGHITDSASAALDAFFDGTRFSRAALSKLVEPER